MRISDWLDLDALATTLKLCVLGLVAWVGLLIVISSLTYFPPTFLKGFLFGRQDYFYGWYAVAFYAHIFSAPAVLFLGLPQFLASIRNRYPSFHRTVGKLYVVIALAVAMPSGLAMATKAQGSGSAVVAFLVLGVLAVATTTMGALTARRRDFRSHRRWMTRSYLLMSSAVTLRILAETTIYFHLESIFPYGIISWLSWLPAIAFYEVWLIFSTKRRVSARPVAIASRKTEVLLQQD